MKLGKLNKEETSKFGDVKFVIYSFYVKNSGIINCLIVSFLFALFIGIKIFSDY
jgi:hypothetical protein